MNKRTAVKYALLMLSIVSTGINANALTIEDYCTISKASPKRIKEIRPMADGLTYSAVSSDGKKIEVFDYKTGKKMSTLFDIDAVKGDLKITDFDGYQLSANGKKVLLWNDVTKIYRHSFTAQYYVYDIMRSTLKVVSKDGAQRGAVISHDGRMVAYVRDNNIFVSNLDYDTDKVITKGGERNKVIYGVPDWSYEEEFGIENTISWSGDDTELSYVRFDESDVHTYSFDQYKSWCETNPTSDVYPSQYSYKYPLAGYPNSKVSVHSYNLDNRKEKTMNLPYENNYIPSIKYDGEGKNLMVMILNRDQNNLNLYKVNTKSTVATKILEESSKTWLLPEAYQMVTYNANTFIIGSARSGYCHLYEYDYNGNLRSQLTKGNWNVTNYYGLNSKTATHYFQCTIRGAVNRNVACVDGKKNIKVLRPVDGTESASFSSNMDYYVRTYSNVTTPTIYSLCNNTGSEIKILEDNKGYAEKYISAPKMELTSVKNGAGEEMNAYIIKPVNFDPSKKYPLLMYQYNGPDSQQVSNKWRMEGIFYLASEGYIIAAVDGRGTGYRNREWANCVYKQLGKYEVEDQISAANYFASLPYVDKERVGCFGWSYGGYMTLMELTADVNPFKVGVAMAPVTDWRYYDSIYTERYMSTPQQNETGYQESSAFPRTNKLNAKLLIMSGTSDDNVHYYNTLKYTSKLFYEGKVFDMMALTGFEHSLPMCNARAMLFKKIGSFLENNLK